MAHHNALCKTLSSHKVRSLTFVYLCHISTKIWNFQPMLRASGSLIGDRPSCIWLCGLGKNRKTCVVLKTWPPELWTFYKNFCKRLKCPAAAPSELCVLEHLKHGVEHGQHDHVALHQPASVQGCSLRISNSLPCQAH